MADGDHGSAGRDGEPTRDYPGDGWPGPGREPATRHLAGGERDGVPRVPTEVVPGRPVEQAPRGGGVAGAGLAAGVPGPAVESAVEQAWRSGRLAASPGGARRVRRLPGAVLSVVLIGVAGVVLYARLHHGPLAVTGVMISRHASAGCGAVVTGRIATNGSPGVVAYRWVFTPGSPPEQRLEQSVAAGQHAVRVTVDVTGGGPGSPAQRVRLQVLDPGHAGASAVVRLRC